MTQYSFKIQHSMHGNDENMLFWFRFKFRITFQLQFLEWNIFIIFYLWFWQKLDIKTKKNKKIISTLFYIFKSLELLIFVYKLKKNNFLAFHGSFIPKRLKNSNNKKEAFCLWLPWQWGCRNDIDYDIKWFAIRF